MFILLAIFVSAIFKVDDPQVTLPQGTFVGKSKSKTISFLGIPYALAPTGSRRFRPPIAINTTSNVINAHEYGPGCITKLGLQEDTSEDCLNLDIYTPNGYSNLPVMVYIFGEGFERGNSQSLGIYDGSRIINEFPEVVIVSINYRLGLFGFMAGSAVEDLGLLNLGLLDQQMAFKWIKSNIAAFGGDPRRITAIGHSAGARSVGLHLLADKGRQELFHRAILLSGSAGIRYATAAQKNSDFKTILNVTNCVYDSSEKMMECLRASPLETLIEGGRKAKQFGPTFDGNLVVNSSAALEAGEFSKIDILVNTNTNEGKLLQGYVDNIKMDTLEEFQNRVIVLSGNSKEKDKLFEIYSPEKYGGNLYEAFSNFFSDLLFHCPSAYLAKTYQMAGMNVYTSRFTHLPALTTVIGNEGKESFHGADLPFVWLDWRLLALFEWPLSKQIVKSYIEFAKGNNPSENWKTYGQEQLYDVVKKTMIDDLYFKSEQCKLFNGTFGML